MGDFLGFTFGGIHSSELGITRVSGGDRYEEELFPEMRDRTAEVPGVNGEYYFGSDYGTKSFTINIAFDSLTEYQLRRLRRTFGVSEIRELIFDEVPYKRYMVKAENPIELSYVCFEEPKKIRYSEKYPLLSPEDYPDGVRIIVEEDENEEEIRIKEKIDPWIYEGGTQRIYKGEGTISLIAYFPFAKSAFKEIPTTEEDSDWVLSSGILTASERAHGNRPIDGCVASSSQSGVIIITTYNPGDVATGIRLYLPDNTVTDSETTIRYRFQESTSSPVTASLKLKPIELEGSDIGVLIDTNNRLITGVTNMSLDQSGNWQYTTSGIIYNNFVDSGTFFLLEPNLFKTYSSITVQGDATTEAKIFYDYLYF